MEERIREVKYEFAKLVAVLPMSDPFWEDAAIPALTIAHFSHRAFTEAIITWEAARRRLGAYRWPATWRDAFKERWFPAWAISRWPIRYREVSIDELIAAKRRDDKYVRYFIQEGGPWL